MQDVSANAIELFKELCVRGYIEKGRSPLWSYAEDGAIFEELQKVGNIFGFDLHITPRRLYIIPDEYPFVKKTVDIWTNRNPEDRKPDIDLMNYISAYLLYLFFDGTGINGPVRTFITRTDFVKELDEHFKEMEQKINASKNEDEYCSNFQSVVEAWNAKTVGINDKSSKKTSEKYGIVGKIIAKLHENEIMVWNEDIEEIRPTQKTIDLIPRITNQSNVEEFNKLMQEIKQEIQVKKQEE